jgi:peroxiredoxin
MNQKHILLLFLLMIGFSHIFAQDIGKSSEIQDSTSKMNNEEIVLDTFTVMKTGEKVPDFKLTSIDGKTFKLSMFKGKTVFLNFFTLSCPSCMKELPILEKEIWQKYKDNENFVIMVVGREETVENLKTFRDKKQFTFPIASDPKRKVYSLFAKQFVPRNIIIDKDGKLILSEMGFTEEKIKNLIQNIDNELNN